jgi:hypothetical protein
VSLQQDVGFNVRVVELAAAAQLVRQLVAQVSKERIFAVTDLEVLEFGGCGYDFDEAADFGLVVERHAEQLDGCIVDVIVRSNHALKLNK